VTVKLRLSSRDRRAPMGRPVLLIDCDSGQPVESFRTHADAMRSQVLLTQAGACVGARNLTAQALHQLAGDTCQRLHGTRAFERLPLSQFNALLRTLQSELRRN
jgi:hypothetical protein